MTLIYTLHVSRNFTDCAKKFGGHDMKYGNIIIWGILLICILMILIYKKDRKWLPLAFLCLATTLQELSKSNLLININILLDFIVLFLTLVALYFSLKQINWKDIHKTDMFSIILSCFSFSACFGYISNSSINKKFSILPLLVLLYFIFKQKIKRVNKC